MRVVWAGLGLAVACTGSSPPEGPTLGTEPVPFTHRPVETGLPRTPSDTGAPPAGAVLVIPERSGLVLLSLDGHVPWYRSWGDLVGSCPQCGGEGASLDDDGGLLLSFTTRRGPGLPPGGIARLDPTGALDFRRDGFAFPHDVIRDPSDGSLIVTETAANRVAWVPGDGTTAEPNRALTTRDEAFGSLPNGAERFDHEGRSYLLLSHRGSGVLGVPGGLLTLWDITLPGQHQLMWRFPEEGTLDTPHGPVFRVIEGAWWLLYAHTGTGTVGVATTEDPTVRPTYVADLEPGSDVGELGFLRGVELVGSALYLTDTGALGAGPVGRVVRVDWSAPTMPRVPRSGQTGDQRFVPLGKAEEVLTGLDNAFEGWLWENAFMTKGADDSR